MSAAVSAPATGVSSQPNSNQVNSLSKTDQKVQMSVREALSTTALSFSFNMALYSFVAPAHIFVVISIAFAGVAVYAIYSLAKELLGFGTNSISAAPTLAKFSMVNALNMSAPQTVIHELGHAFWAKVLINKPEISISIKPFRGGNTKFILSNGLSYFGKKLGRESVRHVVAAGGFMASTLFATGEVVASNLLKGSYPDVSEFLSLHAASQLLCEIVYAAKAFFVNKRAMSHDYVYLWVAAGINPIVPILIMIGLPLSVQLLMSWIERRKAISAPVNRQELVFQV